MFCSCQLLTSPAKNHRAVTDSYLCFMVYNNIELSVVKTTPLCLPLLGLELTGLVFCVYLLQGVRNTLAGEESQVELLKAQLKELFRFSEDSRHLSDDVLAVVKEHQRYVTGSLLLC